MRSCASGAEAVVRLHRRNHGGRWQHESARDPHHNVKQRGLEEAPFMDFLLVSALWNQASMGKAFEVVHENGVAEINEP